MGELTARMALYGAIDHEVMADPKLLERVSEVFPAYRDDSVAGWYDTFSALVGTGADGEPRLPPEPDVGSALKELGALAVKSHLSAAHRLIALWAVAASIDISVDAENFRDALRPVVVLGDEEEDVAVLDDPAVIDERVAELAHSFREFPARERFSDLLALAGERQLLSASVAIVAETIVGIESGTTYITVPAGNRSSPDETTRAVATEIITTVEKRGVTRPISEIKDAMRPTLWPDCLGSFWCAMTSVDADPDDGVDYFVEEVGECPDIWFHPCLKFAVQDIEDAQGTVVGFDIFYGLQRPEDPAGAVLPGIVQDRNILADDGMINAVLAGEVLTVTFTKVIAFAAPLPSAAIALVVEATGWADQTAAMVQGCLA